MWAGFNFGECSGSGSFEQEIENYNGDYENVVMVGSIPEGIQGLRVDLISDKDVDIRLYGENEDKIVHWPYGLLRRSYKQTKLYQDVPITYSGYNGVDGEKGHEYIEVDGATPTTFTMKAFGYRSGYARINYSWKGKNNCEDSVLENGSGHFEQQVSRNAIELVGTIPKDIKNLEVNLTSSNDIDIQLYAEDGIAIVKWPTGILNGSNRQEIDYHGMHIVWSGYNGVNGQKGHEYIKVTPKTTELLTMKVYGYRAGYADVDYTWGNGENNDTNTTDTIAPIITINGESDINITVGEVYEDAGATADDNIDGDITSTIIIVNPVDTAIEGTYVVTYNVQDAAGNNADEVTRTVHVVDVPDTQAPVISLIGDTNVTLYKGEPYIDAGASALDNVDGDVTANIIIINPVDTTIVGMYVIRYNVQDTAGNQAIEVTRNVYVEALPDTTAPVITLLGNTPVTVIQGDTYTDAGASANDNVDGDITDNIVVHNPVDTAVIGTYIITYDVNDTAGNVATQVSRTVNVVAPADTTAPVITLLGSTPVTVIQGDTYTDAGASANDNIDGDITDNIVVNNPVDTAVIGTYIITYDVNDTAGNVATQVSRTVNVVAPVNETVVPLLIIRIEFNDYNFTSAASVWHNKIFGSNAGELNNYMNEISYGKFQFGIANEINGTVNDGIITVSLNENHPNPGNDFTPFLDRLNSAIALADTDINFAQYDVNNDGSISIDELQIMFLVAGGESATGTSPGIWAHAWCMYDTNAVAPTVDGVKVMNCADNGRYSVFGEKHWTHDATIGIIAHELGHAAFNLPDLYDSDGSSNGIGDFGLMGSGSWATKPEDTMPGETPVHMTGWSKAQVGFVIPTLISSTTTALNVIGTSSLDYTLFQIPTGVTGEYFLVENREAAGYDMGLTSLAGTTNYTGGLSILHIDDNLNTNTDETHKWVDIEEASDAGLDTKVDRGHINNLYFVGNSTDFNTTTTPNSKRYDNVDSGINISNISDSAPIMTLDISIN
jgi:M6 family metalloprotease-like protein